ncbi:MAG: hypothetical protein JSV18_05070 [Candidatus Bathyarchaeota archaeon]|nr:MAG: hypothetical protein JSV18_05070 [Candidatus Bathyarchaeota archaeon]
MRKSKRVKNLVFILIVTCAIAPQIAIASAESFVPFLLISTADPYLTAGEENQIQIILKNTGDYEIYQVEAILSVPATTPGIAIIDGTHKIFNKITDGSTKSWNPVIYVDRNTPLGAYTLNLQVSYNRQFTPTRPATTVIQIGVVVNNVTRPELDLDVRMESPGFTTGTKVKASVTIENIGDDTIHDVDVRVTSNSPYVVLLEDSRFTRDSLEADEIVKFTPTLSVSRNAPLGVYTLTAVITYEDAEINEYRETFTLGLTVDTIQVVKQTSVVLKNYSTTPETIHPGDDVDLSLQLECLGAKAYDVKASLYFDPLTGISTLSPTTIALGDLEPGELAGASYRLIVDGAQRSGQYLSTLTLSYLDADGVPKSLSEKLTLSVRGIVDFSLINTDSVEAVAGAITVLEADLLLIGTESVQFVDVDVVKDAVIHRTSESYEYIGAVDPDSPLLFDLEFLVADGADLGDHTLKLKVSYTDDLNQEHETTIEFPITVTEASSEVDVSAGSTGGFWGWLRRLLGLGP